MDTIEPTSSAHNITQKTQLVLQKILQPPCNNVNEETLKVLLNLLIDAKLDEHFPNKVEIIKNCLSEASTKWQEARYLLDRKMLNFSVNLTILTINSNKNNFIELCKKRFLGYLMYFLNSKNNKKFEESKFLKLELFDSVCNHNVGIKWIVANSYVNELFELLKNDRSIAQKAIEVMSKLLDKIAVFDNKAAVKIVGDLLQYVAQENGKDLCQKQNILLEILENLLSNKSNDALQIFVGLKIDQQCEILLTENKTDRRLSLVLNRIIIILAFYKMGQHFEGIKIVQKDPAVMTGFLSILKREIQKEFFNEAIQFCYYAAIYYSYVAKSIPDFFVKDHLISFHTQAILLMMFPTHVATLKLRGFDFRHFLDKVYNLDTATNKYIRFIYDSCSPETVEVAYFLHDKMIAAELKSFEFALINTFLWVIDQTGMNSKNIIKSKEMAGVIFSSKTYILEAIVYNLSINRGACTKPLPEEFVVKVLQSISLFAETYDINWLNSLESVDITDMVIELLKLNTSAKLTENALDLLKILIDKNISPSMALLLDTSNTTLCKIGPLLYSKLMDTNWTIRKAALSVVHSVCIKTQKNFENLRQIFTDVDIPGLVLNYAFFDESEEVLCSALKVLQHMARIKNIFHSSEDFYEHLLQNIVNLLYYAKSELVRKEAIILISVISKIENVITRELHKRINTTISHFTVHDPSHIVQVECEHFWFKKFKHILFDHGMCDWEFPEAIFSKEKRKIVKLDELEIKKRMVSVIRELQDTGLIRASSRVLFNSSTRGELLDISLQTMEIFVNLLKKYKVTPEWFKNEKFFREQEILARLNKTPTKCSSPIHQIFPNIEMHCPEEEVFSVIDVLYFSFDLSEKFMKLRKEQHILQRYNTVLNEIKRSNCDENTTTNKSTCIVNPILNDDGSEIDFASLMGYCSNSNDSNSVVENKSGDYEAIFTANTTSNSLNEDILQNVFDAIDLGSVYKDPTPYKL